MRRKSSGAAVVAVLVGVAVAVTLYIASFGKSSHHAQDSSASGHAMATHDFSASDAAFSAATTDSASGPRAQTAAR
jgi:type II secretory pathway component PulK